MVTSPLPNLITIPKSYRFEINNPHPREKAGTLKGEKNQQHMLLTILHSLRINVNNTVATFFKIKDGVF